MVREYLIYHTIALVAGIILDWIVGDPYSLPHPIRLIGKLIGTLDRKWMGDIAGTNPSREKHLGLALCFTVVTSEVMLTTAVIVGAYIINEIFGIVIEAVLTFYILAAKSLYVESMKVHKALTKDTLENARVSVSMIVGRDTQCLDEIGVAKAAIETVAENTSDGVIAPLIYTALGGPILGLAYKAVNTMDSMVGYHNDRYEYFGRAAAKFDDAVNYIPARLSAIMMIVGCMFVGFADRHYSCKRGLKIWQRDRRNHKSPNSAQTESVCAGCLGIMLAGDASYFGKIVKKPTIGDATRDTECDDIKRANVLMFATECICIITALAIFMGAYLLLGK